MRQLLPIVSCLFLSTPVLAQAVDADGAQRLTDDLARYVGQGAFTSHVVSVTAEGSAYRIAVDFKALVGLVSAMDPGVKIDITPLAVLAKPLSGGNWEVTSDAMPGGALEFDGPQGHQSMNWSISDARFSGIYDPALAAFLSMTGSQSRITMVSKEANQEADVSIGPGTFALTGGASAGGGADFSLSEAFTNFVETVRVADEASGLNLPFSVKAGTLSIDATGQGYRTRALLDLLAFGVANADKAKLTANQAELKALLLAALPVWNRVDGSYRFGDLTTETPVGLFGAKTLAVGFGMDGAISNGTLAYRLSGDGLSVPEQLVPAWSRPLLPTEFDLNVSGVGFDLDSMARKLIDALDLNRDPPVPVEVTEAIGAEFMARPPKVVIARSTVKGGDTEVTAEGEVTFVAGKPQADVAFEVAGYDSVIETVKQAANEQPEFGQYLAFALAAKGFAKTLPEGRLRWEFLVKSDGSVSVNGVTLKGPDPQ